MPTNESLAWGYVVARYETPNIPIEHTFKVHIKAVQPNSGDWVTPTDALRPSVVSSLLYLFDKLNLWIAPGSNLTSYIIYKNNPLPTPTQFWYTNTVGNDPNTYAGGFHPSASFMLVGKTATNRRVNMVVFDGVLPEPQRFKFGTFPAPIQAQLDAILLETNFVSVDGEKIEYWSSANIGYNRRLARKYGRQIAP